MTTEERRQLAQRQPDVNALNTRDFLPEVPQIAKHGKELKFPTDLSPTGEWKVKKCTKC